MSPGDLLRRLDGRIEVLAGGDRSGPVRQQSLAAALDWSFTLLEETERALLSRLAVFEGTFSLDDAEQVCAGHGLDAHAIFAGIAALAGKSLVGCETNGATVRYCLLTTVRAAVRSASSRGSGSDCRLTSASCMALRLPRGPGAKHGLGRKLCPRFPAPLPAGAPKCTEPG